MAKEYPVSIGNVRIAIKVGSLGSSDLDAPTQVDILCGQTPSDNCCVREADRQQVNIRGARPHSADSDRTVDIQRCTAIANRCGRVSQDRLAGPGPPAAGGAPP